ncbi:MAG: VCBS repeat-containing protein, partial [Bacteroidota bacterium]
MPYKIYFFFCSLLLFTACETSEDDSNSHEQQPMESLFQLLSSSQTNINFSNTLEEGLNTNILVYEYFYNGGGVASVDFNGDNLVDLYFTSNMGENELYLNRGNLQFEEVSESSGAKGRSGPWKTGVNATDVNGDGKMDIYVCYSGALPEVKRQNQLFINLGNDENDIPQFEDQAEQYGLAIPAFSTQSYFLDYDRDGDLDMLLLNHNPKNLPILNERQTQELLQTDDAFRGVRLFEQVQGKFEDVTQTASISSSPLTYGLGIGIGDFNNDGWSDFYVSNDYFVPDYLYINNQDGTFSNQLANSIGHTSQFSMGSDVADLNNDGWQDIITLDMLPEDNKRQKLLLAPDNYAKFEHNVRSGFYYQYMRNMLQLNNGNATFSEIGQLAGISNTDWSWAALAADYDNDGWKDLYVTNGYNRDFTNLDFINYMDDFVQQKGRLQREDVLEMIENMPASDVLNYMFQGSEDLKFTDQSKAWG